MGVKDLRKMNVSLLWKWWWKLEHETGIWQRLVAAKYVHGKPIGTIKHRLDDSPIWSDLLKIRGFYMAGRKVEVKNRKQTLFSHDVWLYDMPVKEKFSELYNLCEQKEITVAEVLSTSMQLSFRRWLTPDLRERWGVRRSDSLNFATTDTNDVIGWKWEKNNKLSVKSMYNALTTDDNEPAHQKIWKGKIPAKIKIFMWLLENNAILI